MNKFKPYESCIGRKYRWVPKLYRPFVILLGVSLCNMHINSKNTVRCFKQLIRFFYKSRCGYNINIMCTDNINNEIYIKDGSIIKLSARTKKAALKKIFSKLNIEISDYKALKRRLYLLNITFLFLNINDVINSEILLDINCETTDIFNIFIVTNGYYLNDFYNILYYYKIFINNKPKFKFYKLLNKDLNERYFLNYLQLYKVCLE